MTRRSGAASSEWNVPDWRDGSAYPVPRPEGDDSDLLQWRWEFLRRDEEYREDWLRIRAIDPEGKLALLPDSAKYLDWTVPVLMKEQYKDPYYFQKKYKVKRLFNPRHKKPANLAFYPLPLNYITMKFDLDMPMHYQIIRAEQVLKKYQNSFKRIISRGTFPPKKNWPRFLRAIDAQDQGLSLSEIGYEIHPGINRKDHALHQAKTNASSFLGIGRKFWKKLPIPLIKP